MSKSGLLEKNWHLRLASKRDRATPALNEVAEARLRDLDTMLAQNAERRRARRAARALKPVDLSERFTVAEVAKRLKVSDVTIYEWIKAGVIEAEDHGPTGKMKRISQQALENYLRSR